MVRQLCSLALAAVAVGLLLLTPAPADAQSPATPPLTCTIQIGSSNFVDVEAGPGGSPFPESVSCPAGAASAGLSGECLKWRYKYTHRSEGTLALAAVTVDSDIQGVAAAAGDSESFASAQVFNAGAGDPSNALGVFARNVFDVRAVRFSQTGATVLGTVYTPVNVGPGTVTAGAKVGNVLGFCPIAGASNVVALGTGKIAVTSMIIDQAGKCTIARTVDAAGCTTNIESLTEGCEVTEETPALVGKPGEPFTGSSCSTQVTFGTGTRYCYTSTFGRLTCINSP